MVQQDMLSPPQTPTETLTVKALREAVCLAVSDNDVAFVASRVLTRATHELRSMSLVFCDRNHRDLVAERSEHGSGRVLLRGGAVDDDEPRQRPLVVPKPPLEQLFQRPDIPTRT